MRKWICALLAAAGLFCFPQRVMAADEPEITAAAAVLIDTNSGQVLYEKDSAAAYACGGMGRLMAVYAAAGSAGETVVYQEAENASYGTALGLQQDQKVSVQDLLYAVMTGGYEDCADALHLTQKDFASVMRADAEALGMTASSWDRGEEMCSARDLALLGQAFASDSDLRKLYGAVSWQGDTLPEGTVLSRTLMTYDGLVGGYEAAGETGTAAVVSAERGSTKMTAVVIGAAGTEEAEKDLAALLDYGFANYKSAVITRDAVGTKTIVLEDGDLQKQFEFSLASDLYALMPAGADESGLKAETVLVDEKDPDRIQAYAVLSMDGEEIGRITMQKKVTVLNPKSPMEMVYTYFSRGCLAAAVTGVLLFVFKHASQIVKPMQ